MLTHGSEMTIENGSVIPTTGVGTAGIVLQISTNTVVVTDSTISATGAGSAALRHTQNAGIATITRSTLSAPAGAAIDVSGFALTATITDSTATGLQLLNVDGGAISLSGIGSTFVGAAVTTGWFANLDLQSTDWTVTDDSNVTSLTNGAGSVVHFTPPASSAGPFKTLATVNYVGQAPSASTHPCIVLGHDWATCVDATLRTLLKAERSQRSRGSVLV